MNTAGQSARLLPLEGGLNFRDLGGYPSDDGRQIRWGQLFRSGTMHRLTDADYRHLETLGIKVIYDLRSTPERREAPTDWRAAPAEYLFRDYEHASGALSVLSDMGDRATADFVRNMMSGLYKQMPTRYREAYRELFARLVRGHVPLVFNCAAGKDRTGVAAALVLSALGVPRDVILNDYALSETYVDYMAEIARDDGQNTGHGQPASSRFRKLPREALQTLLRSDPVYLDAMLTSLDSSHGGVLPFLDKELGVGKDEVRLLRETLLEEA